MQLMRLGAPGRERPVVRLDDTRHVDVSDVVRDYDEAFFGAHGGGGFAALTDVVADRVAAGRVTETDDVRVGAPITRPHQILCIGLNYADHAAETGQQPPAEPIIFTKSPNT